MTLTHQINRIKRLAAFDKVIAQREADVAIRSQRGAAAILRVKAACRQLGLTDTVSFL